MADESWDSFISEAADVLTPLPEDTYDFTITKATGLVSKSGNPMVRVSAKVTTGPHAGKGIKDFFVIRMASQAKKFVENMQAMGIDMDLLMREKPTRQQLATGMVGKPFRGKVRHTSSEDYGDAVELSWAMKPPTGGADPVLAFPTSDETASIYGGDSGAGVAMDDDAGF